MKNRKQKLFLLMAAVLCITVIAVSAAIFASAEDTPLGSSADNPYIATTAEELQQYIDSTDNEVNYISVRPEVMMFAVEQSIIQGAEDRPVVIDFSMAGIVEIADGVNLAFCNQATIIGGGAMFRGNEQAIYINTETVNTPVILRGLYGNFNIHIVDSPNVTIGDDTQIFYYDGTPLTVEGNSTVTATSIDLIGQTAAYSVSAGSTLTLDGTAIGDAVCNRPQYVTNGIDFYFANVYDWGEVSPQLKNASSSGHGFTVSKLNETDENGKELYYFTADPTGFDTIRFYDSSYEGTGETNWMALAADGTVYYPTSDTYPCDLGTYKYSSLKGTGTQDDPFIATNEEALREALFDTTNTTTYIKLGASFGVTSDIEFDDYVTFNVSLDLNGNTLDMGENQIDVGYSTTLAITDTSSVKGKITGSGYQSVITTNGDLIINGATIENTNGVAISTTNNPDVFEIKHAYIIGGITHLAPCTIDNSLIDGKSRSAISVGFAGIGVEAPCTVKNGSLLISEASYTVTMYDKLTLENSRVEGGTTASIANYSGYLTVNNSTVGDIYNSGMSDGSSRGVITVIGASSVGNVNLDVLSNTAAKFTAAGEAFDKDTYIGSTVAVSLEGYTGDPITFYYGNKKNITEEQYDGLYAVYIDEADESKAVMASENIGFDFDGSYFQLVAVHTHNYVAGATVDATLTADGYTTYTCSGCGDTYNDVDEGSQAALMKKYIDDIKAELEQADTTLQGAINDKADASVFEKAIEELSEAYIKADAELKTTLSGEIDGDVAALKTELEDKLTEAKGTLQKAIDKVTEDLKQAVIRLDDKDGELAGKIEDLDEALTNAETAIRTDFAKADTNLRGELEEQIKTAKEELKDAIDKVAEDLKNEVIRLDDKDGELAGKIEDLDEALTNAEAAIRTDFAKADTNLRGELEEQIKTAKEELKDAIDKVAADLKNEVIRLDDKDGELDGKITALDEAYRAADAAIRTDFADADAVLKANLESQIATAKTVLKGFIERVQENLDDAEKELSIAIESGDKALEDKIIALDKAYRDADEVVMLELVKKMAQDDKTLRAILESQIANAKETLQNAILSVEQKLNDSVGELNAAIESGDESLNDKITALDKAYKEADAVLNAELTDKIDLDLMLLRTTLNSADKALEVAIDKVQENLDKAVKDLNFAMETKESDLEAKIQALQNACNAADALITSTHAKDTNDLKEAYKSADASLQVAIQELTNRLHDANAEIDSLQTKTTVMLVILIVTTVLSVGCTTMIVIATVQMVKKRKTHKNVQKRKID